MKKIVINDKASEITALEALGSQDTYFVQYFGKDLAQMCQNIRNDFGIEFNTSFANAQAGLAGADACIKAQTIEIGKLKDHIIENLQTFAEEKAETDMEIASLNKRITDLCIWALKLQNWEMPVNASEQFNFFERLAAKLQAGMSLDVDETSYLLGKIEKP
jgi:hypothetical protein